MHAAGRRAEFPAPRPGGGGAGAPLCPQRGGPLANPRWLRAQRINPRLRLPNSALALASCRSSLPAPGSQPRGDHRQLGPQGWGGALIPVPGGAGPPLAKPSREAAEALRLARPEAPEASGFSFFPFTPHPTG